MTGCEQVNRYLEQASACSGGGEPPEPIRAHLAECAACRRLWEFLRAREPAMQCPEAEAQIRQRLGQSLQPVRPLPSKGLLAAGFLVIFAVVCGFWMAFLGLRGAAAMSAVQLAGALAAIGCGAVIAALSLGTEMLPGQRRWLRPSALICGALALSLLATAALFPWSAGTGWFAGGWKCFRYGFLFSLPAAVLAAALLRSGAPLKLGAVGGSAGLLAGLVGMAALHMGCTLQSAEHMLAEHLLVPALSALAGYGLGRILEHFPDR